GLRAPPAGTRRVTPCDPRSGSGDLGPANAGWRALHPPRRTRRAPASSRPGAPVRPSARCPPSPPGSGAPRPHRANPPPRRPGECLLGGESEMAHAIGDTGQLEVGHEGPVVGLPLL